MDDCITTLIMLVQLLERRPNLHLQVRALARSVQQHCLTCSACSYEVLVWMDVIRHEPDPMAFIARFLDMDRSPVRADVQTFNARLRTAYKALGVKDSNLS